MPEFRFDFRVRSLILPNETVISLTRPHLNVLIPSLQRNVTCFFDTGAAVSVVSHSVGWRPLPNPAIEEVAVWNGIPCHLAESSLRLLNPQPFYLSPNCRIVAKTLLEPSKFQQDHFVILGMNFLMDNSAQMSIQGALWNCLGSIVIPSLNEIE